MSEAKRDLIIGGCVGYGYDAVKLWVKSAKAAAPKADIALVVGGTNLLEIKKIEAEGVIIHMFNPQQNLAPHVQRFPYIWDFLAKNDKYGRVVTTDVKDVVFQNDPFLAPFFEDKLMISTEGLLYEQEPWGRQNLYETFGATFYEMWKHWEIFNVGVLAGSAEIIRDVCLNIFFMATNRAIPICDQSVFNYIIRQAYVRPTVMPMNTPTNFWCTNCGTTKDPKKIDDFRPFLTVPEPELVDGMVRNSNGIVYDIVHQYDRVPEFAAHFAEKYA